VDIKIFDHGGFFGRVFALRRIVACFNGATIVGEDGSFGACKGVGWAFDEFGTKDLSGSGEKLFHQSTTMQAVDVAAKLTLTLTNFPKPTSNLHSEPFDNSCKAVSVL
jgi:hypothetical protein